MQVSLTYLGDCKFGMPEQPRLAGTVSFLQILSHALLLALYATTSYVRLYQLHFWIAVMCIE